MATNYFMSYDKVLEFGVPEATVKSACTRYRQGKSTSWANHKDKHDKRRVMIDINSIPINTRKKYNIPTGEELERQLEKDIESQLEKLKDKELLKKQDDIYFLELAYNNDWKPHHATYVKHFTEVKYAVEQDIEEKAKKVAQNHVFWYKLLMLTGTLERSFRGRLQYGFECYTEARKNIDLRIKLNSYNAFANYLTKLRSAIKQGKSFESIMVSNYGKKCRKKTTEFHKTVALQLLCNEQHFSYPVVTDLLNHHCIIEGVPTVTESYIKLLMSPKGAFRKLVDAHRNGLKRFNDEMATYTIRREVEYPANTWMIDGTPLQFFCWNEARTKILRLNLFVVIDACTRKIVGFDIARSEDKFNILSAIKLAVKNEGHLPDEIVSDNFSANKTEEVKDLQKQMNSLGCYWRFSRVGNAQDKGMVERFFGTFQTMHCSLYQDYLGEGITSKRDNRPSKEFMLEHAKKNGYATYNEMMLRISTAIGAYNQQERKNLGIPNKMYSELPKPNAKPLDAFKTAILFWNKTSNTIRRSMVKITVRKVNYFYDIPTNELKLELHRTKVTVRYDEKDMSSVMLFNYKTDTPICECTQVERVAGSSVERTERDEHLTLVRSAKNKSFKKYLKDTKQAIIDKGLEQIGKKSLPILHPASLEKHQIQALESANLHKLFAQEKGLNIDDYKPETLKPIDELKHSSTKEYEELAKAKTTLKGSAKPIQQYSY